MGGEAGTAPVEEPPSRDVVEDVVERVVTILSEKTVSNLLN